MIVAKLNSLSAARVAKEEHVHYLTKLPVVNRDEDKPRLFHQSVRNR